MTIQTKLQAAVLGSGAMLAVAGGPVSAGQVEDLESQINQLQSRLDQIEKQQAVSDAKVASAPADAVVGGDFPGSFKLPGSDTSLAIHGYTKLDLLIDFNQQNGDSFAFTGLAPNGNPAQSRGIQTRLTARQSRLSFETRTGSDYGQIRTYIEGDFFGGGDTGSAVRNVPGAVFTAGNQNVSNSSFFRLRHAYGEIGPFLGGQTWSNFMDVEDLPETLDFDGPVAQVFVRQAQARWTQHIGNFTLSGSVENAQQDFRTAPNATFPTSVAPASVIPTATAVPAAQDVVNAPDFTAKVRYQDSWGHISLSGLLRDIAVNNGQGSASDSSVGGGGLLGGAFNLSVLNAYFGNDLLGFEGIYGSGIGRYTANSGSLEQAAVVKNFGIPGERVETQAEIGGFIWLEHFWTDTLRSNAVYGYQHNHFSSTVATLEETGTVQSVHVNLIWSPVKAVNLGVEFIWGYRDSPRTAEGIQNATGERLQMSAQYLF